MLMEAQAATSFRPHALVGPPAHDDRSTRTPEGPNTCTAGGPSSVSRNAARPTPSTRGTASAERRLSRFADQVAKPAAKPLLQFKTPPQKKSAQPLIPSRSKRIAAQNIAHIPASKRGEYLVRKRLGETRAFAQSTATINYDDIYRDGSEHTPVLRELFPQEDEVGPRKRGRRQTARA